MAPAPLTKLGFMSLFYGAIPGYIVMRGGAAWIANKEGLDNDNVDLTWINIGFSVSDIGVILLIASLVIGGTSVRMINRGQGGTPTSRPASPQVWSRSSCSLAWSPSGQ